MPTIREAAKGEGRPEPRVIAGLPVALTNDPDAAREAAARVFEVYGTIPSYRAMLDRESATGPADVAIVGDEKQVRDGLRRLEELGVTDLCAVPYPAGEGVADRTVDLLADLA